jgi:integrase
MARVRRRKGRKRIGRVSYYFRHGVWHVYYRDGGRQVRRRVGQSEEEAAQIAAQINAQFACFLPTPFSFAPITVPDLRRRFLEHHEYALRSSLATVRRYRAATQHLENFAASRGGNVHAHELSVAEFVRHLRTIKVSANGHSNAAQRPLRDKGVRFVLEVCRSLYGFAAKQRHLPPYAENPFAGLGGKRVKIEDAKPIYVFTAATELAFLQRMDDWAFPIHFTLAKTGLRPGELVHLLVEDLDLDQGWLEVRNKPELGWRIKTRRQRSVPMAAEVVMVLRRMLSGRSTGPVFVRPRFALSPACESTMLKAVQGQAVSDEVP